MKAKILSLLLALTLMLGLAACSNSGCAGRSEERKLSETIAVTSSAGKNAVSGEFSSNISPASSGVTPSSH